MQVYRINEEKVKEIDLSEYVAVPKIIRPCKVCGGIKIAAAVKRDDSNLAICKSCITEVGKAEVERHRVNENLIVGQDWCSICGTKQATSVYQWGNKVKVKVCGDCAGHWFNALDNSPF